MQLETHRPGIRNTPAEHAAFANIVVSVLQQYFVAHYGFELR